MILLNNLILGSNSTWLLTIWAISWDYGNDNTEIANNASPICHHANDNEKHTDKIDWLLLQISSRISKYL